MSVKKDPKTGLWTLQYYFKDWKGDRKHSVKRGFKSKRDAEAWLVEFRIKQTGKFSMSFESFVQLYFEDMSCRLRKSTVKNKKYLFDKHILPHFRKLTMEDIDVKVIRKWENLLLSKSYSQTYIKTIYNQLNALFNYAVRYYDLPSNPCSKAGSIGKSDSDEKNIWTPEEFQRFVDTLIDKPESYLAFMTLFWTGIRVGELLALTPSDIDLDKGVIAITKSYQRLDGEDLITDPKTQKSKRLITIPEFLCDYFRDYESRIYGLRPNDRIFTYTKYYLEHEMRRGVSLSGVKKIRIHDLRHSHASMLIQMGFNVKEIQERLGHEKAETTLNTYSHMYPGSQEKLASKLNSFFKGEDEDE